MVNISLSIDVANVKQAEIFYTQAIGCKKIRDRGLDMVVISTGNCEIYLQEKKAGTKPVTSSTEVRDYDRHWTPVHLDFLVDNVKEVVDKVLKFGGSHEGGESADWGSIAYCADPFGNGFCVINEVD